MARGLFALLGRTRIRPRLPTTQPSPAGWARCRTQSQQITATLVRESTLPRAASTLRVQRRHYLQPAAVCWRLFVHSTRLSRWDPRRGVQVPTARWSPHCYQAPVTGLNGNIPMSQLSIAGSSLRSRPPTRIQSPAHPCAHVPRPGANGMLLCALHGKPRRMQSLRPRFLTPWDTQYHPVVSLRSWIVDPESCCNPPS